VLWDEKKYEKLRLILNRNLL